MTANDGRLGERDPARSVHPWREAHPRDAIQRIADRPCDIFVDPYTCISENVPDDEVCDPCRLIASGAHDLDWSLLDG